MLTRFKGFTPLQTFAIVFWAMLCLCLSLDKVSANTLTLSEAEQAWLKENNPVLVAGELAWAPLDFVDNRGRYNGVAKDYLALIEEKTGIQFEIQANPWHVNLNKIEAGEVDVLPAVYYTPERALFLSFSSPYTETLDYFFTRDDLYVRNIDDIADKTIAIPRDYVNVDYIEVRFPQMSIIEVDTLTDAIDLVQQGEADLLFDTYSVIQHLLDEKGVSNIKPFLSSRDSDTKLLHMAVRHDSPVLLSIINKGLAAITEQEKLLIQTRWLGGSKGSAFHLTQAEKQWLKAHSPIRFTGDPNWLPYEAFTEEGEYVGIVADYLSLLEQKLGVRFERVPTASWLDSVDKMKRGEIDMISETKDSTLNDYLAFSDGYLSSPIVMVMRDDVDFVESLEKIATQRIAMITEYGYVDTIKRAYPDIPFTEVESIQAGLTAVSTGEVDVLLATLAQASYHTSALGINNIHIVGKTEFETELAFGVQHRYKKLVPILNRALADISLTQQQAILEKWGEYKFATQFDYALISKVVIGFLVFMAIMLFWNRKLAAEVQLRKQAETQTKMLIDNLPLCIAVTSVEGNILTANPKALKDYGLNQATLTEHNVLDFYADPKEREQVLQELMQQGVIRERIIRFRNMEGVELPMLVSIMPIKYQHQQALLSIGVDIAERLEIERQLRVAKVKAEVASKAKSAFLANMSHEIRTPMNAIVGFTELLQSKLTDSKLHSYVSTIQSASNDLLLLINDILDLSKIEAGKMEINKSPTNPHILFQELSHIFKLSIEEKGLDMLWEIDERIPDGLILDTIRLRQVLVNLLGNAIKFTDSGFVKLHASIENEDDTHSVLDLKIDVQDTGKGIDEAYQKIIFQDFEQTKDLDRTKYTGTGLGLSISQRLTELMGGKLSVESTVGDGSIFTVHLKAVDVSTFVAQDEVSFHNQEIVFDTATVLVVDDVDYNRALVKEHFVDTNITIVEAENGQEAVDAVKKQLPDLVLMDLRMPVMDGYEAAKRIKADYDVPIIALTASVMKDDFEQSKSRHFDAYIRKPVRREELFESLRTFLLSHLEVLEQDEQQTLSSKEKQQVPALLSAMQQQINAWRLVAESNNLSDIQAFSASLNEIAADYDVGLFNHYTQSLEDSLNVFDIEQVEHLLKRYPRLIEELSSFIH